MMVAKLFTSPMCPACPKAREVLKRIAKEENVVILEFSVNTDEGLTSERSPQSPYYKKLKMFISKLKA